MNTFSNPLIEKNTQRATAYTAFWKEVNYQLVTISHDLILTDTCTLKKKVHPG